MRTLAWLLLMLPLFGAIFNGALGRRVSDKIVSMVGVGTVTLSFALAIRLFVAMLAEPGRHMVFTYGTWLAVDTLTLPLSLVVDPLSGLMMLVVTGIGALIHLYSVGYMREDDGRARFFAYMNLFIFFMLTLVMGASLPLMFVGWEGVGLCSYLLIGYYFKTEHAPAAGLKAFLTNRVGDIGMIIGMMALFAIFGTLTVDAILLRAGTLTPEAGFGVLTFATLMLFVGASGKSAQFPLHIWLPDAMAGPTPVSALIHAATMVTSGVYLLCRLAPIFRLAPITMDVVAWTGAATALFAATIGLVQRDIKKVLAYSTISQLGYMFLALGAGGFSAGFFHVFTHAWFKALLFLGAGSVILGLHHEQDLFKMGGLRKKLPVTFWTMFVGTLAIIGFPGFSGFFSKDEILHLAFLKHPALWGMGLAAALCTAFYMLRLLTLVFWGEARHEHAHESPRSMTIPLMVLAIGSLTVGWWGIPEALGGHFSIGAFLAPSLSFGQGQAMTLPHHEAPGLLLAAISTFLALAAALWGFWTYRGGLARSEARAARWPFLHRLLANHYYVDEAVETLVLAPTRRIGNLLWKGFDVILIDGLGINVPAHLTGLGGDIASLLQTGRVRNYALVMALGILALMWIFLK